MENIEIIFTDQITTLSKLNINNEEFDKVFITLWIIPSDFGNHIEITLNKKAKEIFKYIGKDIKINFSNNFNKTLYFRKIIIDGKNNPKIEKYNNYSKFDQTCKKYGLFLDLRLGKIKKL